MTHFSCTANLGVVPLFRLVAFLFAPALRCLAFLRFSVTAVLDAIKKTPNENIFKLRLLFLTISILYVNHSLASMIERKDAAQSIIMSKGEQKILKISKLKNYSIGNKEIISHFWNPKKMQFLIKGKKTGFTDLIIWEKNVKLQYKVYVLSNNQFLKINTFVEAIQSLNLNIDIFGEVIRIRGRVEKRADYLFLHQLKKKHGEYLILEVQLSETVRREIVGQIYQELFSDGIKTICRDHFAEINCDWYPLDEKHNPALIKELQKNFHVRFNKKQKKWSGQNFLLKLKIIQIEHSDGLDFDIGLGFLQSTHEDLFKVGLLKILGKNDTFLRQSRLQVYSLAEPEIIISFNKANSIELGSEIPFPMNQVINGNQVNTPQWKFAGLKVETKLTQDDGNLRINYSTELSRPSTEGINGNKKNSTLFIVPGKTYKIFNIKYETSGKTSQSLPFILDIPILKTLFSSHHQDKQYKLIEGYLQIEEI